VGGEQTSWNFKAKNVNKNDNNDNEQTNNHEFNNHHDHAADHNNHSNDHSSVSQSSSLAALIPLPDTISIEIVDFAGKKIQLYYIICIITIANAINTLFSLIIYSHGWLLFIYDCVVGFLLSFYCRYWCLNCCCCAGQLEYLSSHSLFLSGVNSIFAVCASIIDHNNTGNRSAPADATNTGSVLTNSHYHEWCNWLSFLSSLSTAGLSVPTHCIATHCDHLSPQQLATIKPLLQQQIKMLAELHNRSITNPANNVAGIAGAINAINEKGVDDRLSVDLSCYALDYRDFSSSVNLLRAKIQSEATSMISKTIIPNIYQQVELWMKVRFHKSVRFPIVNYAVLYNDMNSLVADAGLKRRCLLYLQSIGLLLLVDELRLCVIEPINYFSKLISLFIRDSSSQMIEQYNYSNSNSNNAELSFQSIHETLVDNKFAQTEQESAMILLILLQCKLTFLQQSANFII
jgi:hypothetical protein